MSRIVCNSRSLKTCKTKRYYFTTITPLQREESGVDRSLWSPHTSLEREKETPHAVSTFLRIWAVPNTSDFWIVPIDVSIFKRLIIIIIIIIIIIVIIIIVIIIIVIIIIVIIIIVIISLFQTPQY